MRVFAVSDIHLDYDINLHWLESLSKVDYQDDILILAGDISDQLHLLERCFKTLATRFKRVLFVPGNHDLWVARSKEKDSLEKFSRVSDIAGEFSVAMEPYHTGSLSIVPLLGWYDYSFGTPGEELKQVWMDFRACIWPGDLDVNQYFMGKNTPFLDNRNKTLISFSHFLPRIDVMPAFIPPSKRTLYPVLGSALLDQQVRKLDANIHVYGHSHVNRKITIDNICYINNAFGYPSETMITSKKLRCIFEN